MLMCQHWLEIVYIILHFIKHSYSYTEVYVIYAVKTAGTKKFWNVMIREKYYYTYFDTKDFCYLFILIILHIHILIVTWIYFCLHFYSLRIYLFCKEITSWEFKNVLPFPPKN